MQDGFVKNAADVIKVGETIKARVLSVDVAGKRLALTRKGMGVGGSSEGRRGGGRNAREEEEDDGEQRVTQQQQQQRSSRLAAGGRCVRPVH